MTNLEKLEKIFPEVITESRDADGNLIRAVDFETLREILSGELLDEHEAYEFNFVGKQKARFEAYKRIYKTLRPIISESRDFDSTENLYIEGDNLDALKVLAESYLGKVKMIYIDPPYNTGNDFIYRDDFSQSAEEFDEDNFDGEGNRLFANKESRGRFHSDWCAMIYSRLLIAKHFLSNDGVIFISIDDHEQAALKFICDEVFGEKNFVCNVIWEKVYTTKNDARWLSDSHDFILLYAKDKECWRPKLLPRTEEMDSRYTNLDNDPRGVWKSNPLHAKSGNNSDEYVFPNGVKWTPPAGTFRRYSEETLKSLYEDNRIYFGKDGKSVPRVKKFLTDVRQGLVAKTIWFREEVGDNHEAKNDMRELNILFDTPKPTRLIKKILQLATDKNSIVLDFFSGSATTAHAVMELNAQDGGNRKFILVQLPEKTPDNSEAFRAGYLSICDIGKERIRRAGDKLKAAHPTLDTGFRVFKIDSSNFLPLPTDYEQLILMVENIKDDRDAYDLFFGTLLDMGFTLDKKFSEEILDGYKVLSYDGEILGCFDKNIRAEVFRKLAGRKPRKIIFRDRCFVSSSDKINALEFFKYFAAKTEVKVL